MWCDGKSDRCTDENAQQIFKVSRLRVQTGTRITLGGDVCGHQRSTLKCPTTAVSTETLCVLVSFFRIEAADDRLIKRSINHGAYPHFTRETKLKIALDNDEYCKTF